MKSIFIHLLSTTNGQYTLTETDFFVSIDITSIEIKRLTIDVSVTCMAFLYARYSLLNRANTTRVKSHHTNVSPSFYPEFLFK